MIMRQKANVKRKVRENYLLKKVACRLEPPSHTLWPTPCVLVFESRRLAHEMDGSVCVCVGVWTVFKAACFFFPQDLDDLETKIQR
jgi:hypothetical protein